MILTERDVETLIDTQLENLKWNTNPKDPNRNVFRQTAKTKEQIKSLEGGKPDYVLYESHSNKPLIVIEAKRPNKDINKALEQGKGYAEKINAPIVYFTDGIYTKTLHIKEGKELMKNGEEVDDFISETQALKYLYTNVSNTLEQKVIQSRSDLIKIFESANEDLQQSGLKSGDERFSEFANILFLKLISEIETINEKPNFHKEFRWDHFRNKKGQELLSYVNDTVLKEFSKKYKDENIFEFLKIDKPSTLENIIDKLDPLSLTDINSDIKGDAFEYFIRKYNSQKGCDLGEYFTPRHIVKACVKIANPKIGETVYDPFCGTGGMLIESFKHIYKNMPREALNVDKLKSDTLYGNEITSNARIAKMNMILMGDGHSNIFKKDTLEHPVKNKYDVVITNMPFAMKTNYNGKYDLKGDGNSTCIQHCISSIDKTSENGRIALICQEGILVNKAYRKLREYIFKKSYIQNIISLPHGVFKPYTDTKTNILYLTKVNQNKKNQEKIWSFNVKNDGYTLNAKREKKEGVNDLEVFLSERNNLVSEEPNKLNDLGFDLMSYNKVKENSFILLAKQYKECNLHSNYSQFELSELIEEVSEKNVGQQYKVWSVTNDKGFIESKKRFKERVASKNTSNYKIVKHNYFAYNPARINVGSICFNNSKSIGAVSPYYCVFRIKDENIILPAYLYSIIKNKNITNIIRSKCYGSVRESLRFVDLCEIIIPLPSIEEQRELVSELEKIESIINKNKELKDRVEKKIKDRVDESWQNSKEK